MNKLLLIFIGLQMLISYKVHAEKSDFISVTTISTSDSLAIERFTDSVNNCGTYSQKRQTYLDSILQIIPTCAYAWQQKAMPLLKQKKYELGMTYFDNAAKYDVQNQWQEYRAFIKCIFQKSYQVAITDFEAVKTRNGYGLVMDHSYDFYMGLCYLQLNNFTKANELIASSIQYRKSNFHDSHFVENFYMGIIQLELGNKSQAIYYIDEALKTYPNFSDAKYYKAKILYSLDKKQEAIALYLASLTDMKNGYSINEDNSIYEDYPYNVRLTMLEKIVASIVANN